MAPAKALLRASMMMPLATVGEEAVTIRTPGFEARAAATAWPSAGSVTGTITGGPALTPAAVNALVASWPVCAPYASPDGAITTAFFGCALPRYVSVLTGMPVASPSESRKIQVHGYEQLPTMPGPVLLTARTGTPSMSATGSAT